MRAAAASGETWPLLLLETCAFFAAFRCLRASSLCSLMRIDRFAGAISSPADETFDLDRVWRDGESRSPSRVGGRSLSESDVIAVDVEATDSERLDDLSIVVRAAPEVLPLRFSFSVVSAVLEDRFVCGVVLFRRDLVKGRVMWYTGASME